MELTQRGREDLNDSGPDFGKFRTLTCQWKYLPLVKCRSCRYLNSLSILKCILFFIFFHQNINHWCTRLKAEQESKTVAEQELGREKLKYFL